MTDSTARVISGVMTASTWATIRDTSTSLETFSVVNEDDGPVVSCSAAAFCGRGLLIGTVLTGLSWRAGLREF